MNYDKINLENFNENLFNLIKCADYVNKYKGSMSNVELYLNFERKFGVDSNFCYSRTCRELLSLLNKYTNTKNETYYIKNGNNTYQLTSNDFILVKKNKEKSLPNEEIIKHIKELKKQKCIENIQKNIIDALNEGEKLSNIEDSFNSFVSNIKSNPKKIKVKIKK